MVARRFAFLLFLSVVCLPSSLFSQHSAGNLQVYVTNEDDRPINEQLKVSLISGSTGVQIGEIYTDEHGRAQFERIPTGTYKVAISGQSIQPMTSDLIDVDSRKTTQSVLVRVKLAVDGDKTTTTGGPTVSATNLKLPEQASKEFDKATRLIAKEQWQKAIDQLNKAVALYPAYAEAYTNLGVAYARLGQPDKEREALQKAIDANSRFTPALMNMARLEIKEHNFAGAEAHLSQASAAAPGAADTLALLAQVQLLNHHYEDAVVTAGRVHAISHGAYALVHYIAARACERLNRFQDAVKEFKVFLTEEPSGERAAAARQEMAAIQKQLQ